MKILIFAGGAGTRLWPLSRRNSPKQFDQLINGQSTLQMAVNRVRDAYGLYNIYIQTLEDYVSIVKKQIPELPLSHIFAEPVKRDVAAAIGFALMKLKKRKINEPVAILWSDHLMENVSSFQQGLRIGEQLIQENPHRFVYMAETPRYAENNLGWIKVGKKIATREGIPIYEFQNWHYRPPLKQCRQMLASGEWFWNPGYWITSPDFVLSLYKKFVPQMYQQLEEISQAFDTAQESKVIAQIYPQLEKIHFDKAILEKTSPQDAVVLKLEMGWSDPGTLYALKEAQNPNLEENVEKGLVFSLDCRDCLLQNQEKNKLLTAVGLEGVIVVNTSDALLVVPKTKALSVKDLVQKLEEKGLEKYL